MIPNPIALLALADSSEQLQLKQILNEANYHVSVVSDADELISTAEKLRPAAIIIDTDFGGAQGGIALCRHLKSHPPTRALAVILVCGRGEPLLPTDGTDGRPDEVLVRPVHPPEVRVRLGSVQRLHRYASEAVQGSSMDALTGTFNHTYLIDRLRHEVLRAGRYGRSLALVLVDLDGFGEINHHEGSTSGDLVLREVARALSSRLRGVDLVARSGADEFSVVLPETSLLVARPVAERLRQAVESLRCEIPTEKERRLRVTVSLGISGFPHPEIADVPSLLRCARQALMRAHEQGGNRSMLY